MLKACRLANADPQLVQFAASLLAGHLITIHQKNYLCA